MGVAPRTALGVALLAIAIAGGGCDGPGSELPSRDGKREGERRPPESPTEGGDSVARYFPASFFRQRLDDDAKLDPESDEMVRQLTNMAFGIDPANTYDCRAAVMAQEATWSPEQAANCTQLTTRASIAFDDFAPVLYTVPGSQERVPVVSDNPNPQLKRALAEGVPIPEDAQPAIGSDGQMIIWQPQTDTMWEFWRAYRATDGTWHAGYGGRIKNVSRSPGHFRDVPDPSQTGEFVEHHSWGGPASSIPNLPGLMTVEQLRSGRIGHALVFATWANAPGEWVYPAQRTDGLCRGDQGQYCSAIPQGARFRLDPDYDVSRIEHPVVRMMAEAVQDYGMVLNNSTAGGVSFYAEGWRQHGWEDPYQGRNGLFRADPTQTQPTLFMREFPWERLQMLERGTTCTDRAVECEAPKGWP